MELTEVEKQRWAEFCNTRNGKGAPKIKPDQENKIIDAYLKYKSINQVVRSTSHCHKTVKKVLKARGICA